MKTDNHIKILGKSEDIFFIPNGQDSSTAREIVVRTNGEWYHFQCPLRGESTLTKLEPER